MRYDIYILRERTLKKNSFLSLKNVEINPRLVARTLTGRWFYVVGKISIITECGEELERDIVA